MRIYFTGIVKETEKCKGIWLNTIDVRLVDGTVVVLDRDYTEYNIVQDEFEMEWKGVYIWDGENCNYDITSDMFADCELWGICVEDDCEDGYELTIDSMEIVD